VNDLEVISYELNVDILILLLKSNTFLEKKLSNANKYVGLGICTAWKRAFDFRFLCGWKKG
jgi:hypothetical protein